MIHETFLNVNKDKWPLDWKISYFQWLGLSPFESIWENVMILAHVYILQEFDAMGDKQGFEKITKSWRWRGKAHTIHFL